MFITFARLPVVLLLLAGFLAACSTDSPVSSDDGATVYRTGDVIPGRYIILFQEAAVIQKGESLQSFTHGERLDRVDAVADKLATSMNIPTSNIANHFGTVVQGVVMDNLSDDDIEKLRLDPRVRLIEQDRIVRLPPFTVQAPPPGKGKGGGSTDPAQTTPWGIELVGTSDASSSTVVAYICDTGIDLDHHDLNVNAKLGHDYTDGTSMASGGANSQAKGGNGGTKGGGPYASLDDKHGHGTHVSGTVGAIDNSIGVVGVAAGVTLVPMKVLRDNGSGSWSWSIAAFDDIAANANTGDVVNFSIGSSIRLSAPTVEAAVQGLADAGVLIAMSAGNESDDAQYYSPKGLGGNGNTTGIYTIGSIKKIIAPSPFSNWGTSVDFWEPGGGVYSTWKDGGYRSLSGTSMASPHACGILAVDGSITSGGSVTGTIESKYDGTVSISGYYGVLQ